ncbi:hypothetical protein M0G43_06345 [Subsaxibacter sp. CAU 1640]|uniref:hypothetical protein n=1 Tax=Subsaxibacter sp. CAU 1640 TaxID=2933271 RepID=UPI00200549CB|nr:hypothetical protein [Subsaxibacter sp. CAU 1640]MCK7590184.1 hypothetical protein [Subsaxibacter sp. CAU 1640]
MKFSHSILLLSFISLTSCVTTSYQTSFDSDRFGIDYRKGKWLLNTIQCPLTIQERMTKIATKHFSDQLGENFKDANTDKSIALSYIPLNPDSLSLKDLKRQSRSDYIINIVGEVESNEIGSSDFGTAFRTKSNSAKTTMQVYDLNTLQIIFTKTVSGSVTRNTDDSKDFKFFQEANGIIVKCLKKIINKL